MPRRTPGISVSWSPKIFWMVVAGVALSSFNVANSQLGKVSLALGICWGTHGPFRDCCGLQQLVGCQCSHASARFADAIRRPIVGWGEIWKPNGGKEGRAKTIHCFPFRQGPLNLTPRASFCGFLYGFSCLHSLARWKKSNHIGCYFHTPKIEQTSIFSSDDRKLCSIMFHLNNKFSITVKDHVSGSAS